MYNLLVHANGWSGRRDTMHSSRVFEFTPQFLRDYFTANGNNNYSLAARYPTLFMEEDGWERDPVARVGEINEVRALANGDLQIVYRFNERIPPILNSRLHELAVELDIEDFEFSRTHWAVKEVDLYQVLYEGASYGRPQPEVFQLNQPEITEADLVSVMMPFHPHFNPVHNAIVSVVEGFGMRCQRADDIWINPAVIQDVVSLIDRSRLVICDCSQRNPNVFYEMGIAHALGREVIAITQSEADIPFDIRHLRYVHYLNNAEGLVQLAESLARRLRTIVAA
ncbi:hypothetical protein KUV46_01490 [Thalassovita mediterranea]|nr:hypothetical protein KUV46_01490 [Thalassovita mediterranea]